MQGPQGSLKHSFTEFEQTGSITASANHTRRCIETSRQAVMGAVDLPPERFDLEDSSGPLKPRRGNSGWGNAHDCRDWTSLVELFRRRGIVRSNNGRTEATFFNGCSGRVWIASGRLGWRMSWFQWRLGRQIYTHKALTTVPASSALIASNLTFFREVSARTRQSIPRYASRISTRTHQGCHLEHPNYPCTLATSLCLVTCPTAYR